ncbi:hypothetical protein VNI00_009629 [Paramarasmius palmivorus]|uniref:Peroxin-14 n=1 Tax=Paramarasmius palmivorus TaxID=297713 RepID=A0AAW0CNF0_9AGAR
MASVLNQYASFPFDSDDAFKQGLAGIIARSPPEANHDEISRKAKVFYFNRVTGNTLSIEEAETFEQASAKSSDVDPSADSSSQQQQESLTLAQIKEFIETGRADQLPNNKVIPGGLNEEPPSQSTATARKKPWEVD